MNLFEASWTVGASWQVHEAFLVNGANLHQVSSWDATKPEATPARLELFDMEKVPFEQQNVYNGPAYAKVAENLKQQLLSIKKEVGDLDESYPELLRRRNQAWWGHSSRLPFDEKIAQG